MEEIVTLSEEHLNPKNLVVVTSEENRMVVKCTLIVKTIFKKIKATFPLVKLKLLFQGLTRRYEATECCLKTFP